jgi:hypothetical protein
MRKLSRNKGLIRRIWEGPLPPPRRRENQTEKDNGAGFSLGLGKSSFQPMALRRVNGAKQVVEDYRVVCS